MNSNNRYNTTLGVCRNPMYRTSEERLSKHNYRSEFCNRFFTVYQLVSLIEGVMLGTASRKMY